MVIDKRVMRLPDIALPGALALAAFLISFQISAATSGINKHIIGGDYAVAGQFPWQVLVWLQLKTGIKTYCGGSIISSTWILSAAHCYNDTYRPLPVQAFFGGILFRGTDAEAVAQNFKTLIRHEDYDPEHTDFSLHDLLLIELSSPLHWSDNILPVTLPSRSQPALRAGTPIVASGFGRTFVNDEEQKVIGLPSPRLKYLEFELRDDDACDEVFNLCSAYYTDLSLYYGDSGGAWVWKDPSGVSRIVGVISDGNRKNGVFYFNGVSVHSYLDWISSRTGIDIED